MINLERADPGAFQRRAGTRTLHRRELKFGSAFEPWEPANVEIKIVSIHLGFDWKTLKTVQKVTLRCLKRRDVITTRWKQESAETFGKPIIEFLTKYNFIELIKLIKLIEKHI